MLVAAVLLAAALASGTATTPLFADGPTGELQSAAGESDDADAEDRPHLVVSLDDGTDLLAVPVEEGDEVSIEYTHSVERTLVTDVYVADDGALVADRMLFSSFGAGLPSEAAVTREGDRYVYEPPKQRYDELVVSTGPVAGHELVVAGDRYDLADRADGGTVTLRIESRPRSHG